MNGKVKRQQPLWRSLIWARVKRISLPLLALLLAIQVPIFQWLIGPSYTMGSEADGPHGIYMAASAFALVATLTIALDHGGTLAVQVISGASRRRLEITSWVTDTILAVASAMIWLSLHSILHLFPQPIHLPTNGHPTELALLVAFVFLGGVCGHITGMILRRFNQPGGFILAYAAGAFLLLLGSSTMVFVEPGVNLYMTLGFPLWAQIIPTLALMGFTYSFGCHEDILPFQR